MKLTRVPNNDLAYALRQILTALDNNLSVADNFRNGNISLGNGDFGPYIITHAGSPEGAVAGTPGSLCTDSVAGELYVKQGTGTTGWKLVTHA